MRKLNETIKSMNQNKNIFTSDSPLCVCWKWKINCNFNQIQIISNITSIIFLMNESTCKM